ncbi:MAG: response regulator, partial [Myxococcales bacterium]|nr:response regulator [Myxococcales bacterium]
MTATLRVMVIDADATAAARLARHIEAAGHQVLTSPSGQAGLGALADQPCDVMLADLVMPGLDGLELLDRLRTTAPDVRVVLMAQAPEAVDVVEAFRAGAADFLLKPVSRLEISRCLARVSGRATGPLPTAGVRAAQGEAPAGGDDGDEATDEAAATEAQQVEPEQTRRDRAKLLDRMRRGPSLLPVPTGTLQAVARLSHQDDPDPEAVFELLESDATLSSTVFKLAQTPRFRGSAPPGSTRDAAVRVGALRALSAASSVCHRDAYTFDEPNLRRFSSALWLTHFLTSLVAEELWDLAGHQGKHQLQSIGLFMSVGEVVALRAAVDLWRNRFQADGRPQPHLEQLVASVQAEAGARILTEWHMPAVHVFCARHHADPHPPAAETAISMRLTCLRLARHVVTTRMPRATLGGAPPFGVAERAWAV